VVAHFNSIRDYFSFVAAKGFYDVAREQEISYSKTILDTLGTIIVKPTSIIIDRTLKNIRNPLVITALTIVAISIATIIFYPAKVVSVLETVLPFIFHIQPWMLKLATFAVVEIHILAIGIRTLGRLNNRELMQAWTRREIIPIAIGTRILNT
jgi:hypothetical protein